MDGWKKEVDDLLAMRTSGEVSGWQRDELVYRILAVTVREIGRLEARIAELEALEDGRETGRLEQSERG